MMEASTSKTSKDILTRTISFLKNDIQHLLDKKKGCMESEDIEAIDFEKNEKMIKLKEMTEQLKVLNEEKNKNLAFTNASRAVDSINYAGAKRKKGSYEAIEEAKKVKEQREVARDKYNDYLEYFEKYNKCDPENICGVLFLHESLLSSYGLCPYIKVENFDQDTSVIKAKLLEERKAWLLNQSDKGKLYYDLYDQLVNEKDIINYKREKEMVENEILNFIKHHLSDSQFKMYVDSIEVITQYTSAKIKTKKLKERYKELIHSVSILFNETQLNIHGFLAIKYDCVVVVNDNFKNNSTVGVFFRQQFEELLEKYIQTNSLLDEKTRYCNNVVKNLRNELYLYLTDQKKIATLNPNGKHVVQKGKFFKRWTILTEEERNDRFTSFSDFHIERFMIRENLIDSTTKNALVESLAKMLIEKYKEKMLVYKNFKWNTTKGIIEHMNVLKYNQETKEFGLSLNAGNKHKEQVKVTLKKKTSIKSIFNNVTEKITNEEILYYIVKNGAENISKEECFEKIKNKLNVKKISMDDKKKILAKYEEIVQVVKDNKE